MFIRESMRLKISLLAAAALLAVLPASTRGQGCVAARGTGLCGIHGNHTMEGEDSKWEGSIGYRWLQSDRHFTGDHEDVEREEQGSQVINNSNFIDASVTYFATPRFNFTFTVPFVVHDRSSTVVFNGVRQRFHTQSQGLSDIRLSGHAWLMDPASPRPWNVLLGLGVDAPTGQKDYKDIFVSNVGGQMVATERNVDQSVQPGDGGWGITLDVYAYYQFTDKLTGFVNGAYTITPEEQNGVLTGRGANRPLAQQYERFMSIADAYLGRLGVEYMVWPKYGLSFSLANRIEGVPVYDLIGGSDWFRRPGYSMSIEPGVMANVHGWKLALYTPVAYYNNRERSVPDLQSGGHGDAAFADFQVLFSIAHAF